jgi:hypothetical protein
MSLRDARRHLMPALAVSQQAARTLDFGELVAVMMLGILGQIPDCQCACEDPGTIVAKLLQALPPGSYLALRPQRQQPVPQHSTVQAISTHMLASPGWNHDRAQLGTTIAPNRA